VALKTIEEVFDSLPHNINKDGLEYVTLNQQSYVKYTEGQSSIIFFVTEIVKVLNNFVDKTGLYYAGENKNADILSPERYVIVRGTTPLYPL